MGCCITVDIKKGSKNESGFDSANQDNSAIQSHINQERHNAIREICNSLSCDAASFGDDEVQRVYEQIKEYKRVYIRWFYSDISNCIFGLNDSGNFLSNIEELQEHADNCYRDSINSVEEQNESRELIDLIDKLWDHASLAQQQMIAMGKALGDPDEFFAEKIEPKLNNTENNIRKELISLIAIFTALSFIVFGGISSLDNIFDGAKQFPVLQVLIIGSIWGLCMFNLVFLFVFFVSKLTNLNLSSTSDAGAKVSKKYPAWVWGNYIMLLILSVTSFLYFLDYSNSGNWLIELAQDYPEKAFWFGLGFIVVIAVVAYLLLRNPKKKS